MNKKITTVFFTAILSINIGLISQAEEQPVINDEACSSGSAAVVSVDDLPPDGESEFNPEPSLQNIPETDTEEFPKTDTAEVSETDKDLTEINEDTDDSAGFFYPDKESELLFPFPAYYEEAFKDGSSYQEFPELSGIDPPAQYPDIPWISFAEYDKFFHFDSGNMDSETDSEEGEPPLPNDNSSDNEIAKDPQQPQQDNAAAMPVSKGSSSGSGSGSSNRKYSDSQTSEVSFSEDPEISETENAAVGTENDLQNSEVYSGEELTEKADPQKGTITFEKNGAGLEIPADFIENNNIQEDDIISVSINRNTDVVDVSIKINDEAVNEIEGAKIIIPDNDGKISILPADSLGEYYISGSYNKTLWPLGAAFPFVIALAYILLMGGAAAALWKKIRSM